MEHIGHKHIYEDFSRFELKNLSPPELQERLLADLQPHTDYESRAKISAAFELAAYLHADDERSPGPYISHPARIANRIVTHFGVRDPELVMAALLHDTVEDHAQELAQLAGVESDDIHENRAAALEVLEDLFGERVASTVSKVTNPIYEGPPEDKNQFYFDHVKESIQDPDALVIKLSDFVDNAVGLHHTENAGLIRKLSRKYDPLYPVFEEALDQEHPSIDPRARPIIKEQILMGQVRNKKLMAA